MDANGVARSLWEAVLFELGINYSGQTLWQFNALTLQPVGEKGTRDMQKLKNEKVLRKNPKHYFEVTI